VRQSGNPVWMPELGLGIGHERGRHEGMTRDWLYWYDEAGTRYPAPNDVLSQEKILRKREQLMRIEMEEALAREEQARTLAEQALEEEERSRILAEQALEQERLLAANKLEQERRSLAKPLEENRPKSNGSRGSFGNDRSSNRTNDYPTSKLSRIGDRPLQKRYPDRPNR
jgi:hypothetical protein